MGKPRYLNSCTGLQLHEGTGVLLTTGVHPPQLLVPPVLLLLPLGVMLLLMLLLLAGPPLPLLAAPVAAFLLVRSLAPVVLTTVPLTIARSGDRVVGPLLLVTVPVLVLLVPLVLPATMTPEPLMVVGADAAVVVVPARLGALAAVALRVPVIFALLAGVPLVVLAAVAMMVPVLVDVIVGMRLLLVVALIFALLVAYPVMTALVSGVAVLAVAFLLFVAAISACMVRRLAPPPCPSWMICGPATVSLCLHGRCCSAALLVCASFLCPTLPTLLGSWQQTLASAVAIAWRFSMSVLLNSLRA